MREKRRTPKNYSFSKILLIVLIFVLFKTSAHAITFSVSVLPHYALPISESHSISSGTGVGAKLSLKPFRFMDFFVKGDYLLLTIPKVDSIKLLSASVGTGYNIPLSERFSLSLAGEVGFSKSQYKSSLSGISAAFSAGINYKFRPSINVGTEVSASHFSGGGSQLFTGAFYSPSVTLNLSELFASKMDVQMEVKEIQPVFPVLHSWYEHNSFGTIQVVNEEDVSIKDVSVSFYQPQYMSQPTVCATIPKIGAGESADIPLTAFFNERMLDLIDKTDAQATVTVSWSILGQKQEKEFPITIPVYGRNNMSWDDDRKAASFVSSKDPAALWFAKYIAGLVSGDMRNGVPDNIQKAMGIFESLDKFGLSYVIDPSSAYSDNIGGASIDFLQFPYQTLMYRGGDCDDISILTCSLFEAVGIPTAFITIPGHIFMAFNSGITKAEAEKTFLNMNNFIVDGDEVWVPLEITLSDEGFNKSWRVGAREWNTANNQGEAQLYKMADSWKLYPPVNVPGAAIKFTMPDDKAIASAFENGITQWVTRETQPIVDSYLEAIAQADEAGLETTAMKNTLGALYGQFGLFDKAQEMLEEPILNDYSPALLNSANIKFAQKDFEGALELYGKTLGDNPGNALALLGVARSCYELQKYDECDDAYAAVRMLSPELAKKYSYLGAFENQAGRSFSLRDRIRNTVWPNSEDEFFEYDNINDDDDEDSEDEEENENSENENSENENSEIENSEIEIEEEIVGLVNQITIPGSNFLGIKPDEIFEDTPELKDRLQREEEERIALEKEQKELEEKQKLEAENAVENSETPEEIEETETPEESETPDEKHEEIDETPEEEIEEPEKTETPEEKIDETAPPLMWYEKEDNIPPAPIYEVKEEAFVEEQFFGKPKSEKVAEKVAESAPPIMWYEKNDNPPEPPLIWFEEDDNVVQESTPKEEEFVEEEFEGKKSEEFIEEEFEGKKSENVVEEEFVGKTKEDFPTRTAKNANFGGKFLAINPKKAKKLKKKKKLQKRKKRIMFQEIQRNGKKRTVIVGDKGEFLEMER